MENWAKAIKDGFPTVKQMHEALVKLSKLVAQKKEVNTK